MTGEQTTETANKPEPKATKAKSRKPEKKTAEKDLTGAVTALDKAAEELATVSTKLGSKSEEDKLSAEIATGLGEEADDVRVRVMALRDRIEPTSVPSTVAPATGSGTAGD